MSLDRPAIQEILSDREMNLLLMDGFDEAIIGYTTRMNQPDCAVYDYDTMVNVCMWRDGMTDEEAIEYIEFNCQGAWMGEETPYIVRRFDGKYA
jgi:hypothetical protein